MNMKLAKPEDVNGIFRCKNYFTMAGASYWNLN